MIWFFTNWVSSGSNVESSLVFVNCDYHSVHVSKYTHQWKAVSATYLLYCVRTGCGLDIASSDVKVRIIVGWDRSEHPSAWDWWIVPENHPSKMSAKKKVHIWSSCMPLSIQVGLYKLEQCCRNNFPTIGSTQNSRSSLGFIGCIVV